MLEARSPDERGRVLALVDITGFTSWAEPDEPARIVFGPDRRLERVDLRLRFGTSVRIRFGAP